MTLAPVLVHHELIAVTAQVTVDVPSSAGQGAFAFA